MHQRNRGRLVFTEIQTRKEKPITLTHPILRLRHNLTKYYLKMPFFIRIYKVDLTVVSENGNSSL